MCRTVLRVFALAILLTIPLVALTARAQEGTPAADEGTVYHRASPSPPWSCPGSRLRWRSTV
ncbi:MAG: hypothetical protein M3Q03_17745 [Chloroflexota bacterium]|nr:hypothetical protein [Chloroflexota bacterium]